MGVIDQILQEERDRKAREDAAYAAVMALSRESRRSVLVRLIDAEEGTRPTQTVRAQGGSFTDKAEAFVLSNPNGVRTRDVASAIGQDVSSVDGTLRQAMRRGNIRRDGRLWVPQGGVPVREPKKEPERRPRKPGHRDRITEVLVRAGQPLGVLAIFEALKEKFPDINRASVEGEIHRMKQAGLMHQVGIGANNGGLYALKEPPPT